MSNRQIMELVDEITKLSADADRLHKLVTSQIGEYWKGTAYKACLRESMDNRESWQQVMARLERVAETVKASEHTMEADEDQNVSLPTSILL